MEGSGFGSGSVQISYGSGSRRPENGSGSGTLVERKKFIDLHTFDITGK
jgi:hypothetical protein